MRCSSSFGVTIDVVRYYLLPLFDLSGRGHGRSQGRDRKAWVNGKDVLKRALRVDEAVGNGEQRRNLRNRR